NRLQLFERVEDAASDLNRLYATTARPRDLPKPVITAARAAREARAALAVGDRVGILFGPERTGLENEDIVPANAIITVPVNPDFPSLNLAQCVLLTGYEWKRQEGGVLTEVLPLARSDLATREEVERLGDHFEERLDAAGFFFPETKAAGMRLNLRNMWARLNLTRAEVQTFHGMLRQIAWKLRQGSGE
ncbi:MAG TPA: TrmH family RNA methyltransferase, partial [Paracoccaceae bacterium]|nr:TrmH family RNA methyltransferase [Paracoccaceae bacterium]